MTEISVSQTSNQPSSSGRIGIVVTLIIIAIVLLAGVVGYFIFANRSVPESKTQTSTKNQTQNLKTYTVKDKLNFEFKYPREFVDTSTATSYVVGNNKDATFEAGDFSVVVTISDKPSPREGTESVVPFAGLAAKKTISSKDYEIISYDIVNQGPVVNNLIFSFECRFKDSENTNFLETCGQIVSSFKFK